MNKLSLLLYLCWTLTIVSASEHCAPVLNSSNFSTGYCGDLLTWNMSNCTLKNIDKLNNKAFELYQEVYDYWLHGEQEDVEEEDIISNDCLGVARISFCAVSFPYWTEETQKDENIVCSYLCNGWKDRCANLPDNYSELVCANNQRSNCSFTKNITISVLLLLLSAFTFLIG